MIVQIKHVHNAVPIRLACGLAMNPDGSGECTFGAMLCFDEALELICVRFFHRETFLVCMQFMRSNKRHKYLETKNAACQSQAS